jgi:ATP-dependent protease Clp ATPase subunit
LTVKSLKTAQEVFVYGFCSRFLGRIEISPQFIASSKEDFLKVLKQEIGFKLLLPFAFLFGIFLCRARIRTLEKKEDRIEKIIASSDMICKKCARNQADIVLLPCNHLVLCSSCESEVCPMCHKMIERRKKIFSG